MKDRSDAARRREETLLFLTDGELRGGIEATYLAYRGFTSEPDGILRERGYGRAHLTPFHANGFDNDIRSHVTRRKISFGACSDAGRAARDGCLGSLKTCSKLGVSFRDYLCDRLGVADARTVPRLADLIRQRAAARPDRAARTWPAPPT